MHLFSRFLILFFLLLSACKKDQHTNDLIHETSPYLLQHAHNPVNWKAWNKETLELAKKENKLLIISIGYSACHWCHVMEEESFENDSIAKIMNENFISIKVDREERPDIDQVYIDAVQAMTGKSGWPLNCIALPNGKPVFGGTYFTKEQWESAISQMSDLYKINPDKVISYANNLTNGLNKAQLITQNSSEANFKKNDVIESVKIWKEHLDFNFGGNMGNQKFPLPNNLSYLMRYAFQFNDLEIKNYVENTLNKMANGGIYDQIGGGFSRYSVDGKWHIPHFEKMLYDNAQLTSLYSKAYLITKNENYKNIVFETLQFVERELSNKNGAFYSSLDADSKNENNKLEEGSFYAWKASELKALLIDDFDLFAKYYNINANGLWEKDLYVLFKNTSDADFAKNNDIEEKVLKEKIINWKKTLFKARDKRPKPHLDDKTLTSWNALMIKGYLDAYKVFKNPNYLKIATKNANFILENLSKKDGGLFHNYKNEKSTINGYLEDYATVIDAFISLYQVTFNEDWLKKANQLTIYSFDHFYDDKSGLFFFTSDLDDTLITRKIEIIDGVIPSSNSILAKSIFELSHYYSNKKYESTAKSMLNTLKADINVSPSGYSNWLETFTNYTNPYYEIAISGENALSKLTSLNQYYLPNVLISGATAKSKIPLLEERFYEDKTYIYVCVDGTCKLPETIVEKAINKLEN